MRSGQGDLLVTGRSTLLVTSISWRAASVRLNI